MSQEYKCTVSQIVILLGVLSKRPASLRELKKIADRYAKEGIVCWNTSTIKNTVEEWIEKGLLKKGKGGKLEVVKKKIEENPVMRLLVEQSVSLIEDVEEYLREKESENKEHKRKEEEETRLDPATVRKAIETISFLLHSKGVLTKDDYTQLVEAFGPETVSTVITWLRLIHAITRDALGYRVVKENEWILERLSMKIEEIAEE